MTQATYKRGSELPYASQRAALSQFVNRYTKDHRPRWTRNADPAKFPGGVYPVQFASDADWLANTRFAVTKSGALDRRVSRCESSPTWPDNPELRNK